MICTACSSYVRAKHRRRTVDGIHSHHSSRGPRRLLRLGRAVARPSLRGRPIAVGGGVVLARPTRRKGFGVRAACRDGGPANSVPSSFSSTALPGLPAARRCRDEVTGDFTPLVERISIDEAFADVAGCTHLFGPPAEIAKKMRRVRAELGLAISVGVARTKHLARSHHKSLSPMGSWLSIPTPNSHFFTICPSN